MINLKEKQIQYIRDNFEVLAKRIINQIDSVNLLFNDNSIVSVYEVIEDNEYLIDGLEVKIREEIIHSIVLYSPRATDCRLIISYHDMTAYLERIGDLLLNISHFIKSINLSGALFLSLSDLIKDQMMDVKKMIQNAIFAFTCNDAPCARRIIQGDAKIDERHHAILKGVMTHSAVSASLKKGDISDIISISTLSYNIERMGDNAVNIAESALFLMEGKKVKHSHTDEQQ